MDDEKWVFGVSLPTLDRDLRALNPRQESCLPNIVDPASKERLAAGMELWGRNPEFGKIVAPEIMPRGGGQVRVSGVALGEG